MRSYLEIARRIAKIIVSPETAIGFADGVLSVPTDIGYLAYGFIDTDSRYQRETEKIRMFTAIKMASSIMKISCKQLRRYWPSSIKVCRKRNRTTSTVKSSLQLLAEPSPIP